MNAAFYRNANQVIPGDSKRKEQRRHRQLNEDARRKVKWTADPAPMSNPAKRKQVHPRASTPPQSPDLIVDPAVAISAYLRSSYDSDERPRRTSYAEYDRTHSPTHSHSHGVIRRLSDNFNAPTDVELERHSSHTKELSGMGKLKSVVRGWVKA